MDEITLSRIFAKLKQDLLDAGHGASRGMTAGLVGAPVDITSMALRGVGLPIPQNPVGGSEWIGQKMENLGVLRPPTNTPSEKMGNVLGGLITPNTIGKVGQATEQGIAGLAKVGGQAIDDAMMGKPGMLNQALRPSQPLPMMTYHGSPHNFDAFDATKIGTGESLGLGGLESGQGAYLASNKKYANEYRTIEVALPGMEKKLADLQYQRGLLRFRGGESEKLGKLDKEIADVSQKGPGYLYTVDMPDALLPKMLNLDWPLSKQPPSVKKAIEQLPIKITGDPNGEQILESLQRHLDPSYTTPYLDRALATEALKKLGVTGTAYKDNGQNFVVFDPKSLKILKKE